MVSPKNLSKSKQQQQLHDSYNGCEDSFSSCLLGSDHLQAMAEEDSRTSSCLESDSKEDDCDERWLQLGLGGSLPGPASTLDQGDRRGRRDDLVELDLFLPSPPPPPQPPPPPPPQQQHHHQQQQYLPGAFTTCSSNNISRPFLFQQHPRTSLLSFGQQEVPWGYNRPPYNLWHSLTSDAPSSSSSVPRSAMGMHQSPSFSGMRVIDAPPRPQPGVWFMIQASQNQAKEPFLPQISKRYIRIKDGKMTISMLIKYLVKKLSLNSESEVEITCRGVQLPHFLTLQHVRDNIWCSNKNAAVSLFIDPSTTTDHVMVLNYGRIS